MITLSLSLLIPVLTVAEQNMHRSVYTFESFTQECLSIARPEVMREIHLSIDMPSHFVKSLTPHIINSPVLLFSNIDAINFVGENSQCQFRAYEEVPATLGHQTQNITFLAVTAKPEGIRKCVHGGNVYIQYKTPLANNCLITLKAVE